MVWSGNKAPEQSTDEGQSLALWVEDELERFSNDQIDNLQAVDLRPIYNAPLRPRAGMLAYADGTKWNPGFGEGLYNYDSNGLWLPKGFGRVKFPATQVSSTDVNTLDDYEEGPWTPALSFVTPGNLVVAYSLLSGYYTKIGRLVTISFAIVTSTFTHTTASGNAVINGMPFTPIPTDANYRAYAPLSFQGINKVGYSAVTAAVLGNSNSILLLASGMGSAIATLAVADLPTATVFIFGGSVSYVAAT